MSIPLEQRGLEIQAASLLRLAQLLKDAANNLGKRSDEELRQTEISSVPAVLERAEETAKPLPEQKNPYQDPEFNDIFGLQRLKDEVTIQILELDKLKNILDDTIAHPDLLRQQQRPHNIQHQQQTMNQKKRKWPLSSEEYTRYARQLVLPEVGLPGQLRLKSAAVLVIGVGGLGCPAAAYLAGAGVGHIGLVDADTVDTSNLHRQILHSADTVGMAKVDSAIEYIKKLNPLVKTTAHPEAITPQTAIDLISRYDLVLDCTDNPATRYLISDACVITAKPLVSASALRTDGQLMVLNNPSRAPGDSLGGPCYRCVFPTPPPPETVTTCGEGGILGPVVGVMGVLQALEAIKVLVSGVTTQSVALPEVPTQQSSTTAEPPKPSLLIFSAMSVPAFRQIKLRSRRANCAACSASATVTRESLTSGSLDYVQFCGVAAPINILSLEERISAQRYNDDYLGMTQTEKQHPAAILGDVVPMKENSSSLTNNPILLDVRPKEHFALYSIPKSINIPYTELARWKSAEPNLFEQELDSDIRPIYVLCAQGNDSQYAVQKLKSLGMGLEGNRYIGDIEGGWKALRRLDRESGYHEWPDI